MTSALLARPFRIVAFAIAFSVAAVSTVRADPLTVTSGELQFGRGGADAYFPFPLVGADGFLLQANGVPIALVSPSLCPSGCRPGAMVNLSLLAGAASGRRPEEFFSLPPAFTLGVVPHGAVVNGTVFGTPGSSDFLNPLGLAGSLRFDAASFVLPSSQPFENPNAFGAPFVFTGNVTGFAIADVDARTPLFNVDLVGQGTAFIDFESGLQDGVFQEPVVRYFFAAPPAATPEPMTLGLLASGLVGLIARARPRRRLV